MSSINVGHTDTFTIQQNDANGNPMQPDAIVPWDSPPQWSNSPSAAGVDTFVVSADGTSAVLTATAPGSDSVSVTATAGGKSFSASVMVTITAAPQVLTSISIIEDVE